MEPIYLNERLKTVDSGLQPFKLHHPGNSTEVLFDFKRHIQIEMPKTVKTLDFQTTPFPYAPEVRRAFPGLAYTEPFRLLSDEGVQALRAVIDMHKDNHLKANGRQPGAIRGLGFLSQFVRDLSLSEELAQVASELAYEPLAPDNMTMNYAHTNFGIPGAGKAVDQWHTDVVDYVFVVILSDITDMQGGELQVLQMPDASGNAFDKLKLQGIPSDLVETVSYKQAGYCIFCQGSKILHSVTPVLSAREPRISVVQSYCKLNVFAPDRVSLTSMRNIAKDPLNVTNFEYARHKAWRIQGQMRYLMEKAGSEADVKKLASFLENAGNELLRAKALLLQEAETGDSSGFLVNENDKMTKEGLDRTWNGGEATKIDDATCPSPKARL